VTTQQDANEILSRERADFLLALSYSRISGMDRTENHTLVVSDMIFYSHVMDFETIFLDGAFETHV